MEQLRSQQERKETFKWGKWEFNEMIHYKDVGKVRDMNRHQWSILELPKEGAIITSALPSPSPSLLEEGRGLTDPRDSRVML